MKDIFETDWNAELQDGDTAIRRRNDEEIPVVLLKALQRLARAAGIVSQDCRILTPSSTMVQAVFTATFTRDNVENVTFVGCGDCSANNTTKPYSNFPTSVAESRAEARCLKKALGIEMLASEEIGFSEAIYSFESAPSKAIDTSVVAAIEKLCDSHSIELAALLDEVVKDSERNASVFKLNQLTQAEGQAAMQYLNSLKPAKLTAKDKRDARKKELSQ